MRQHASAYWLAACIYCNSLRVQKYLISGTKVLQKYRVGAFQVTALGYVSIRQHTSAYRVAACQATAPAPHTSCPHCSAKALSSPAARLLPRSCCRPGHTDAYVSIRMHTSAYGCIRMHTSAARRLPLSCRRPGHTDAYVSIRPHTSEYVRIREHT
jgi:hypothetical protein